MNKFSYANPPISNKIPEKDPVSLKDVYTLITTSESLRIKTKAYRDALEIGDVSAKDLKNRTLPYVAFSGVFTKIRNNGLLAHSGLISLDFDNIENVDAVVKQLKNIKDISPCLMFISPSGDGIKLVYKVQMGSSFDMVANLHNIYFLALAKFLKYEIGLDVDPSCKDLARGCFLCYDKDAYINENAPVISEEWGLEWSLYNKVPKTVKIITERSNGVFEEYNANANMRELVEAFGGTFIGNDDIGQVFLRPKQNPSEYITSQKSGVIFKDTNLFYVYTSSWPPFESGLTYSAAKLFCMKYANNDWNEARKLLYLKGFGKKANASLLSKLKETEQSNKKPIPAELLSIFEVSRNGTITLLSSKYAEFLKDVIGISAYWADDSKKEASYVLQEGKVLTSLNSKNDKAVIDLVVKYIKEADMEEKDRTALLEAYAKFCVRHPSANQSVMPAELVESLRDDKESCNLYFANGVLHVTKDNAVLQPYSSLPGLIWSTQILPATWEGYLNYKKDFKYYHFIEKVCDDNPEKLLSLKTMLGFLIHSYKPADNSLAPCLIFVDEIDLANAGSAQGGTGKGLVLKCLNYLKDIHTIDGKSVDPKKNESFAGVTHSTQIVLIDDIDSKFNFESLFVKITGDFTLRSLHQNAIQIPYKLSPKMVLTSNHPLTGTGDSHLRRQFIFEMSKFFGSKRTPAKHFGEAFFDESWGPEHWQMLHCFLVDCVQTFFKHGLIAMTLESYEKIQLISETSEEFVEWADLNQDAFIDKKITFNALLNGSPQINKKSFLAFSAFTVERTVKMQEFKTWFRRWAKNRGFDLNECFVSGMPAIHLKKKSK